MHAWISDVVLDDWTISEPDVGFEIFGGCFSGLLISSVYIFGSSSIKRPWHRNLESSLTRHSWSEMVSVTSWNVGLLFSSCFQQFCITSTTTGGILSPISEISGRIPLSATKQTYQPLHRSYSMGVSHWISPKQILRIHTHRTVQTFSWAGLSNILELCIAKFRLHGWPLPGSGNAFDMRHSKVRYFRVIPTTNEDILTFEISVNYDWLVMV